MKSQKKIKALKQNDISKKTKSQKKMEKIFSKLKNFKTQSMSVSDNVRALPESS